MSHPVSFRMVVGVELERGGEGEGRGCTREGGGACQPLKKGRGGQEIPPPVCHFCST